VKRRSTFEETPACETFSATARRELEEVWGRAKSITELGRDLDTLLESYEALAAEELDDLAMLQAARPAATAAPAPLVQGLPQI
jgi:hypothetical protein